MVYACYLRLAFFSAKKWLYAMAQDCILWLHWLITCCCVHLCRMKKLNEEVALHKTRSKWRASGSMLLHLIVLSLIVLSFCRLAHENPFYGEPKEKDDVQ